MREGARLIESAPTVAQVEPGRPKPAGRCVLLVVLAAVAGLGLLTDSLWRTSATYDEVLYLQVAARWWRTGDQADITGAGSPLLFWKLQQVPMLWALDRHGYGEWIDHPDVYEARLLPLARTSGLLIWLAAFGLVAYWSRRLYGPDAMVLASWWFALSPNLLAHGALVTMELPVLAAMTAMFLLFWDFLRTGSRRAFVASAVMGGMAFSCKFTTAVVPPILGMVWLVRRRVEVRGQPVQMVLALTGGMAAYVAILLASDVVFTAGALLPISGRTGHHPSLDGRLGATAALWVQRLIETPVPQDWVGFIKQMMHQRSGAPGYLMGEVRETGWRHYYLVALAVKVPLMFWVVLAVRGRLAGKIRSAGNDWILPVAAAAFLVIASVGSTRNFGVRYLLPVAPLAIVWISGLAEAGLRARRLAWCGLVAQAVAVASIHPYELSYFNILAGGPIGGRRILSDSNLDWSQGLKLLANLQRERPELRDLTLYCFGDTEAGRYGVQGRSYTIREGKPNDHLPPTLTATTPYLAVSATLQFGPWKAKGYFRPLDGVKPVCYTPDTTIAIYRTADVPGLAARDESVQVAESGGR